MPQKKPNPTRAQHSAVRAEHTVKHLRRPLEPTEKEASDLVLTDVWETFTPRLSDCVRKCLRSTFYFSHATNIQRMVIPLFSRDDVSAIVEASTGSGKTLSFLIPLAERMLRRNRASLRANELPLRTKAIASVVLSPSRTLSRQTFTVARQLFAGLDFNLRVALFGDTQSDPAFELSKYSKMPRGGGTVLVTTPRTLLDLLRYQTEREAEAGQKLKDGITFLPRCTLVVDEADVVCDRFAAELADVVPHLGTGISLGLFGATATSSQALLRFVESLGLEVAQPPEAAPAIDLSEIDEGTRDDAGEAMPERDAGKVYEVIDSATTLVNLRNCNLFVPSDQAFSVLVHMLNKHPGKKHFIFFNDGETLEYVASVLEGVSQKGPQGVLWKLTPYLLHPGVPEARRLRRFRQFLGDPSGVLLSTDICAFGIDVREVDYVLHWQAPSDARVYTHRIGRTGRMGCRGTSVLFIPSELRDSMGGYMEQLDKAFPIEEYRCPRQGVYNVVPLVKSLLMSDPALVSLAHRAAAEIRRRIRKAGRDGDAEATSKQVASHVRMLALEPDADADAAPPPAAGSLKRPREADAAPPKRLRAEDAAAEPAAAEPDAPVASAPARRRKRKVARKVGAAADAAGGKPAVRKRRKKAA